MYVSNSGTGFLILFASVLLFSGRCPTFAEGTILDWSKHPTDDQGHEFSGVVRGDDSGFEVLSGYVAEVHTALDEYAASRNWKVGTPKPMPWEDSNFLEWEARLGRETLAKVKGTAAESIAILGLAGNSPKLKYEVWKTESRSWFSPLLAIGILRDLGTRVEHQSVTPTSPVARWLISFGDTVYREYAVGEVGGYTSPGAKLYIGIRQIRSPRNSFDDLAFQQKYIPHAYCNLLHSVANSRVLTLDESRRLLERAREIIDMRMKEEAVADEKMKGMYERTLQENIAAAEKLIKEADSYPEEVPEWDGKAPWEYPTAGDEKVEK